MKRLFWVLVVLLVAGIVGGAIYESKMETKDAAAYPAPGKLVDVAGRKLHIWCAGQGSPTVIFEASGHRSSTEWEKLLPEVAKKQRACAYDRAGNGWSDPVSGDRSASDFVEELRGALTASGEKPPYVLVGHGGGGVIARAYQAAHPDDVVGLVLVDSKTASVLSRWPKVAAAERSNLQRGRWLAAVGLLRLANPLHLEGREAALTYRPRTMVAAQQLVAATSAILPSLPPTLSIPTVVLTHGRGGDWAGPGVIGPLDEAAIEYDWQAAQKELAKGPKSSLVVADKSGTMISAEQPELIVQAIETVSKP
ncbi:MAG TPA: alpha/beta fold hydrolase [Polyangia bacterium]|jgi:pimeloyl-ACP methyl ester carboxylesterase